MTFNLETLWGAPAPKYLSGVRDDYCHAGANSHWTDVIPSDRLAAALRSDPRTDVGETIRELIVSRRDQTRRAELVSITGRQKRSVSGWEFKLIAGGALGWNVLKSSRFTISRSGSAFVFHGSGFGHGLGLCQEGAREMAQRGYNFRQILARNFGNNVATRTRTCSGRLAQRQKSAALAYGRPRFYTPPAKENITVRDLIRLHGENNLWQRVARRSYDVTATAR